MELRHVSPLRSSLCWQCCFFVAQHGSLEGLAHIGMSSQAAGVQPWSQSSYLIGWAEHAPATEHVPNRADSVSISVICTMQPHECILFQKHLFGRHKYAVRICLLL